MSRGYPTPDNPVGDVEFTCLQFIVPNIPAFQAALYGLYSQMANDYFWTQQGTMTPQEAAFLASRGLGETTAYAECEDMSCVDLADCIDTDEAVQTAMQAQTSNQLLQQGYTPNPDSQTIPATPQLTAAQQALDLIDGTTDCSNPAQDMAIARSIVREINETLIDLFEIMELATNPGEGAAIIADEIPVASTASSLIELADWILETAMEVYQAAYTQSAEDTIACKIFCKLRENCTISLDDLIEIYSDLGSIVIPDAGDIEDLIEFMITTTLSIDVTGVAIWHYHLLQLLRFGGKVAEMSGFNSIKTAIKQASGTLDTTYEDLCEDCVEEPSPTTYWRLCMDLRISRYNTETVVVNGSGNDGKWVGNGYEVNMNEGVTTLNANFGIADLGAQYVVRAAATKSLRRGSNGNGTHDFANNSGYSAANYVTGTSTFNNSFINVNTNEVIAGLIAPAAVALVRSMKSLNRVNIAVNARTGKLRVYYWVIWGLAGAGNTKPPRATWAGSSLPATLAGLFPS